MKKDTKKEITALDSRSFQAQKKRNELILKVESLKLEISEIKEKIKVFQKYGKKEKVIALRGDLGRKKEELSSLYLELDLLNLKLKQTGKRLSKLGYEQDLNGHARKKPVATGGPCLVA